MRFLLPHFDVQKCWEVCAEKHVNLQACRGADLKGIPVQTPFDLTFGISGSDAEPSLFVRGKVLAVKLFGASAKAVRSLGSPTNP